jgi:hypothetical protein
VGRILPPVWFSDRKIYRRHRMSFWGQRTSSIPHYPHNYHHVVLYHIFYGNQSDREQYVNQSRHFPTHFTHIIHDPDKREETQSHRRILSSINYAIFRTITQTITTIQTEMWCNSHTAC